MTIKKEPEVKIALAWDAFRYAFENSFSQKIPILGRPTDITDYDLIIFSGGEDISPSFYEGDKDLSYGVNPERDQFEYDVFCLAKQISKKMLGVCRGHQLINVLTGANFVQDLRFVENVHHPGTHDLVKKDSKFISHFTSVNSMHHQGILQTGGRLYHTSFFGKGKSGNYIVESSENEHIVTVQFHPEFMQNGESEEFFRKIKEWSKEKVTKKDIKKNINKSNGYDLPDWVTTYNPGTTITNTATNEEFFTSPAIRPLRISMDEELVENNERPVETLHERMEQEYRVWRERNNGAVITIEMLNDINDRIPGEDFSRFMERRREFQHNLNLESTNWGMWSYSMIERVNEE
jgi:putative glutamine amidotransferase